MSPSQTMFKIGNLLDKLPQLGVDFSWTEPRDFECKIWIGAPFSIEDPWRFMPLHLLVKEGLLSRDLLLSPNLLLSLNIHYYQRFHCPFLAYSYSSLVRQSGYYSITQGKLVNPIKSCFLRLRRRSGTCIDCPSKNVFPRLKFNKGLRGGMGLSFRTFFLFYKVCFC